MSKSNPQAYKFEPFYLDKKSLWQNGKLIRLTKIQFGVLRLLVENYGQLITFKDLEKKVWQQTRVDKNSIHQQITALRKALGESPGDNIYIKTEVGVGYRFVAAVEEIEEELTNGDWNASPAEISEAQSTIEEKSSYAAQGTDSEGNEQSLPSEPDPLITSNHPKYSESSDTRLSPGSFITALAIVLVIFPFGLAFAVDWNSLKPLLSWLQALGVGAFIAYVPMGHGPKSSNPAPTVISELETKRSQTALDQFRLYWRLLLVSWLLLYMTLLLPSHFPRQLRLVTNTLLNNSNSLMLALCYIVLNRPTVIDRGGEDIEDVPFKEGLGLIVIFGLLEVLFIWFGNLGWLHNVDYMLIGADLISGIVGCVTMALCISRLHSRLLSPSNWLPVVLYLYVAIQPLYIFINLKHYGLLNIDEREIIASCIIHTAFLLKTLMYFYVIRLLESGRLFFYLVHARRIYDSATDEWEKFKTAL